MSTSAVRLLQAASEIVGGNTVLALRLGIGETLLERFLEGQMELPDPLLLRAVDIILSDRHLSGLSSTNYTDVATPSS